MTMAHGNNLTSLLAKVLAWVLCWLARRLRALVFMARVRWVVSVPRGGGGNRGTYGNRGRYGDRLGFVWPRALGLQQKQPEER